MGAALRRNIPAISAGGLVAVTAVAVSVLGVDFAQAAVKPAVAPTSAPAPTGDGLKYLPIKEVFRTPVGPCDDDGTTIEMANCFLVKVVGTDRKIDALQQQRFNRASSTKARAAVLKDDATWLKHRRAEVRKVGTGGTLDTVLQAQKTLELSEKRLNVLQ
jgi:uncharacterized protein YecT (DUF1311 family)